MATVKNLLLILLSIFLTQLWLNTPSLNLYSLQLFTASFLGYFITKKLTKTKMWHIIPNGFSLELIFITPAILLLTGATGGLESFFYPLIYAYLLIIAISCTEINSIIVAIALALFYYSLNTSLTSHEVANLVTLLVSPIFFLFVKKQYQDVQLSHSLIKKEAKEIDILNKDEFILENFIINFTAPKLSVIKQMLSNNPSKQDIEVAKNQLSLVKNEGEKILKNINAQSEKENK